MDQFLIIFLLLGFALLQLFTRLLRRGRAIQQARSAGGAGTDSGVAEPAPLDPEGPSSEHVLPRPPHARPPRARPLPRAPGRAFPSAAPREPRTALSLGGRSTVGQALSSSAGLRRAMALAVVLGPPRALERPEES